MTINHPDTDHPDTDHSTTEPVGTIHRRVYLAGHIEQARRIAPADPHRPVVGETVRLTGSRIIVTIVDPQPHVIPVPGRAGEYTWECHVGTASAFQTVIHQQIEIIEDSLRRTAQRRGEAP